MNEQPDLRLGRWQDVMQDVECSTLICDCPYSTTTHDGHDIAARATRNTIGYTKSDGITRIAPASRETIDYKAWTPADVDAFVDFWAPRTRGWMVSLTDDILLPAWKAAMARHNRVTFQDVPAIISGMTVRLCGDGPSSWAIHIVVSRPRTAEFAKWGTLDGGYFGPSEEQFVAGGKPVWLMRELVKAYSRVGDVVCDPTMGGGTTILAAMLENRRSIGCELDAATFAMAKARIADRGRTRPAMYSAKRKTNPNQSLIDL